MREKKGNEGKQGKMTDFVEMNKEMRERFEKMYSPEKKLVKGASWHEAPWHYEESIKDGEEFTCAFCYKIFKVEYGFVEAYGDRDPYSPDKPALSGLSSSDDVLCEECVPFFTDSKYECTCCGETFCLISNKYVKLNSLRKICEKCFPKLILKKKKGGPGGPSCHGCGLTFISKTQLHKHLRAMPEHQDDSDEESFTLLSKRERRKGKKK